MFKKLLAPLAMLVLVACSDSADTLKVGGKDFSENMILSEMIAALAEAQGIPVDRHIPLGPTALNLDSLKRGEIDIYVEYSGTGLVMLGQPALSDGDKVIKKVRSLYEPLGVTWGKRLGFSNSHGLAMRADRAAELDIATISDLVAHSGSLVIGIEKNFENRPVDGFTPLTARYGMSFEAVKIVESKDRMSLYDALLSDEVDLIEVFTTDGKLDESGVKLLVDDLGFFPAYDAAPLVRADALVRFPSLQESLDRLSGKLDEEAMRKLNRLVDQESFTPRDVALVALVEMGLLENDNILPVNEPIRVSMAPSYKGIAESRQALRAVRKAFPGRHVRLDITQDPLKSVGNGTAVIGLVTTAEFVSLDDKNIPSLRPFEAVGVVGQSYLHIIAFDDAIRSLLDVKTLATGPKGSGSYRAGQLLAAGLGTLTLKPVNEGTDALNITGSSGAEARLILAPLGSDIVKTNLVKGKLIPLAGWGDDNKLGRFPYLRQARIPANIYKKQREAIETLSSQLVLAGPRAFLDVDTERQGGEIVISTSKTTLTDDVVRTLSKSLAAKNGFDPAVPSTQALRMQPPNPPMSINPDALVSILNIIVLIFIVWLVWLYIRPEPH